MSVGSLVAVSPGILRAQAAVVPADSLPARNVGVVQPGDGLRIAVFRERDLNGEYVIDSRGAVQIPGLGVIQVAGMTPTEVRARLRDQLVQRGIAEPEFAVQVLVRVSVLGEVRQAGLHTVDPGTSLIQLVSLAGGATASADLSRTQVTREGRVYLVDLENALQFGGAAGRIPVYSNDIVHVPRRGGLTRENIMFVLSVVTTALSIATLIAAAR